MDKYELKIETEGRERIFSIIDIETKIVYKSIRVYRMPFSGGNPQKRQEMELMCKKLNENYIKFKDVEQLILHS